MSDIGLGCDLTYDVHEPTTFLFNLSVAMTDSQRILDEQLTCTPQVPLQAFQIGFAQNRVQRLRLLPCEFRLQYSAIARLAPQQHSSWELNEQAFPDLPPEVLPYLNPSRFCESDILGNFAMREFGSLPHGYSRIHQICDWIHREIRYEGGSTTAQTTARDVFIQRSGVCRDFAHLAISFCRALGIPARYVSGYAVDLFPQDFHGFFEVYLGSRWYLFDATKLAPLSGLVRIASGHDAADVPFATYIGYATLRSKTVWANRLDSGTTDSTNNGPNAVSTA